MTSIALVHEWLDSRSGSEKTFEELARTFPTADLYALSQTPGIEFDFGTRVVKTTWLANDLLRDRRGATLPLMPLAWQSQRLSRSSYDLTLTSTHAFGNFAHATKASKVVLCYCHTPARYLWSPELDDRGSRAGWALAPARAILKRIDLLGAQRVTEFAANSTEVVRRIETFYQRPARLIPPPVDTRFFSDESDADLLDDLPDTFLMAMSRFIPYKRLDLAISVAAVLKVPIIVAGFGGEEAALRDHARAVGADARFHIRPDQVELRELFRRASVFIFPAFEDFGIVPVEAQASGTPVVAYGRGGSVDTVLDGVTGALAFEQTADAFVEATSRVFELLSSGVIDADTCRKHARSFASERFRVQISEWVSEYTD